MIKAGKVNYQVRTGRTFRQRFTLTAGGEPVDLSAVTAAEFVVYDNEGNVVFDVTDSSTGESHIDLELTAGAVTIRISDHETGQAEAGCYRHYFTLYFANGDVDDYLEGEFSVN